MRQDWAQQFMLTSDTMWVSEYNANAQRVLQLQPQHSVHGLGVSLMSILCRLKILFTVATAVEYS